ncbi:MAG: metallopeptidase TldD-related protein [Myxococcota bacterium]
MIALLAAAWAQDPIVTALQEELQRSMSELVLPDSPRPYFVAYRMKEAWNIEVRASLGGVLRDTVGPDRRLVAEVRVGSPEYDSVNFRSGYGSENGLVATDLVIGDAPLAVRKDAWLGSDAAYKEGVANLSAKEAADARRSEGDTTPDYTLGEPLEHLGQKGAAPDLARLRELAVAISARFAKHPDVELSSVTAWASGGRFVVIDSLGMHVERPIESVDLEISGNARAADGSRTSDLRSIRVRTLDDLPSLAELERSVDDIARALTSWQAATIPEEPYIGPLLVEGSAAVDLFRRRILTELQGTPDPERPVSGTRRISFGSSGSPERAYALKRRILPRGWTITDDPQSDPRSPAWRTHDDEGTPTQAIELVTDGIVRTHYMSRTPSSAIAQSNGHGRSDRDYTVRGSPMVTELHPDRTATRRRLHKEALKITATYGNDHYLVLRRYESDIPDLFRMRVPGHEPLELVRVFANGREEHIRGVELEGLTRRALRDAVMAGDSTTEVFRSGSDHFQITAPSVLLDEVEAKPRHGSAEKPPPVASPLAREPSTGR